jgi:hypothetical protein
MKSMKKRLSYPYGAKDHRKDSAKCDQSHPCGNTKGAFQRTADIPGKQP